MAILNFPNTRPGGSPLQEGDTYTGDNGVIYTYDGVKWLGRNVAVSANADAIINSGYVVQVDTGGNLVTPSYILPNTVGTTSQVLTWPASGNTLVWTTSSGMTRWDQGVNDLNCPIFTELTTSSFIANTGRTHLELYQTGDWSVGSRAFTRYIDSDDSRGIALTTDRGTVFFGNHPEQCTPITAASHFHIMRENNSTTELFFGDDFNYVKLPKTDNGLGVEIGTNGDQVWRFGTDGVLNFPNNNGQIGQLESPYTGLVPHWIRC